MIKETPGIAVLGSPLPGAPAMTAGTTAPQDKQEDLQVGISAKGRSEQQNRRHRHRQERERKRRPGA